MERLRRFERLHNKTLQAVEALWNRTTSISMGGPFSSQSTDLHSLWRIKKAGKKLRDLGTLHVSEEGYVFWTRGHMWFSLCQFRDNILLVCNLNLGSETSLVQEACLALSSIWDLEVLCDRLDSGDPTCEGKYLAMIVRALGISMIVGGGIAQGSTHSAGLAENWSLRHSMPLITPG